MNLDFIIFYTILSPNRLIEKIFFTYAECRVHHRLHLSRRRRFLHRLWFEPDPHPNNNERGVFLPQLVHSQILLRSLHWRLCKLSQVWISVGFDELRVSQCNKQRHNSLNLISLRNLVIHGHKRSKRCNRLRFEHRRSKRKFSNRTRWSWSSEFTWQMISLFVIRTIRRYFGVLYLFLSWWINACRA